MQIRKRTSKIETSLTAVFALSLMAFLPILAFKTYFADSEIWSVNLGFHFTEEFQNYWVFSRTIFYSALFSVTGFFSDPVFIFMAARALMVANSFLQIFLVFSILKNQVSIRFVRWFSVLVLIANTFYLTQSFRIRSDLLVSTFLLAAIYLFIKYRSHKRNYLWLLAGAGISLITTPKSIFFIPILAVFYIWEEPAAKRWKPVLLATGSLVGIFLASLYLRLGVLSDLAIDLQNYLINTLRGEGGPSYLSHLSFTYVTKLFTENYWLLPLWAFPYFVPLKKIDKKWFLIHTYLILLLFLAPEKLPFFICSLLPVLACSSTILFYSFFKDRTTSRLKKSVVIAGISILFFASSLKVMNFMYSDTNREQLKAMTAVNNYLQKYPDLTYYDVIGLAPRFSNLRHFAGPNQANTNRIVSDLIVQVAPDVILKVAKIEYLTSSMNDFLYNRYIDIGNGFHLKAFPAPDNIAPIKKFIKVADKKDLSFISPMFEKYRNHNLVFQALDSKGNSYTFESIENYLANKPEVDLRVVKISPLPLPDKLPPRDLDILFKFDTEF